MKRLLSSLLGQRPKIYNSLILNLMGLQVLRILLDRAVQVTRRRLKGMFHSDSEARALASELQQNGIVMIKNFLPPEVFNEVSKEFAQGFSDEKTKFHRRRSGPVLLEDIRVTYKSKERATLKHVRENALVREIIETASGVKIRLEPTCVLQTASQPAQMPEGIAVQGNIETDAEQIWHQDHIYGVYKAWLYLGEVNNENGAFEYGINSQRMNGKRLMYEYRRSLYLMDSFKRFLKIPAENIFQGRIVMDPETKKSLNVQEIAAVGPANTLVIANTLGLHRRGKFQTEAVRKLVHLDFRKMDSVLNSIPLLKNVVNLDDITG